ncbi:MAG: hypothetical protein J5789_01835 [Oscillospiraceae bacterium]|nr:hypothetical protein [Oscillospiraceae bacterium]
MSEIVYIRDDYTVFYNDKVVGYYRIFSDGTVNYETALGSPWNIRAELQVLGLDRNLKHHKPVKLFTELIREENRVPGRKRILYRSGPVLLEREAKQSGPRYSVYRRSAEKNEPDYSPLPHDAPHREGPNTPANMREWASWYAFNKMDDGTYEAELDEAWCWGGSHNDGGTMHNEIPEEWFHLPYEEFLVHVVTLSAAAHYGFTPEMLLEKKGLRQFFGFESDDGGGK